MDQPTEYYVPLSFRQSPPVSAREPRSYTAVEEVVCVLTLVLAEERAFSVSPEIVRRFLGTLWCGGHKVIEDDVALVLERRMLRFWQATCFQLAAPFPAAALDHVVVCDCSSGYAEAPEGRDDRRHGLMVVGVEKDGVGNGTRIIGAGCSTPSPS